MVDLSHLEMGKKQVCFCRQIDGAFFPARDEKFGFTIFLRHRRPLTGSRQKTVNHSLPKRRFGRAKLDQIRWEIIRKMKTPQRYRRQFCRKSYYCRVCILVFWISSKGRVCFLSHVGLVESADQPFQTRYRLLPDF